MRGRRFVVALLLAVLPFAAAHPREAIRSISVTATVLPDGSADVVQVWDATVETGTEMYIPVTNLGGMKLSDFRVYENGTAYEDLGLLWNVHSSLAFKAGKCGIVQTSEGYELCWGKGSYGSHVWEVRYHLSGLVQSMEDADGFNFQFVNPGLSPLPEKVTVTIANGTQNRWSDDVIDYWGFGFNGDIWLESAADPSNPSVVAESSEPFRSNSSAIIMMRLDKGLVSPTLKSRYSTFEKMRDKAFKKSDYGDDDEAWYIGLLFCLGFVALFGVLIYCVIASALGYKYKKSLFGTRRITGWWREAPFGGNIPASFYVLSKGNRFSSEYLGNNVIGAYFLKWIMEGVIRVSSTNPSKESATILELLPDKYDSLSEGVEQSLYRMVEEAAGDNRLLEPKEFERWSKRHYSRVAGWPDKVLSAGSSFLVGKKVLLLPKVAAVDAGAAEQMRHVIEFKNFLKDFTLSDQREAVEVGMWKNYLVFAQLLGIADKVAKQFKKLFPAEFRQVAESLGTTDTVFMNSIFRTNYISSTSFNNAMSRKAAQQVRTSGGGGHTSFGGGGGFSGGGFGGGSR